MGGFAISGHLLSASDEQTRGMVEELRSDLAQRHHLQLSTAQLLLRRLQDLVEHEQDLHDVRRTALLQREHCEGVEGVKQQLVAGSIHVWTTGCTVLLKIIKKFKTK